MVFMNWSPITTPSFRPDTVLSLIASVDHNFNKNFNFLHFFLELFMASNSILCWTFIICISFFSSSSLVNVFSRLIVISFTRIIICLYLELTNHLIYLFLNLHCYSFICFMCGFWFPGASLGLLDWFWGHRELLETFCCLVFSCFFVCFCVETCRRIMVGNCVASKENSSKCLLFSQSSACS